MENRNRNNSNRNRRNDEYDDRRSDWQSGQPDDSSSNFRNNMNRDDDWNNRGFGEQQRYGSSQNWESNRRQNRNTSQDRNTNYGLGDTSQGSGNYGNKDYDSHHNRSYGTGNLGRTYFDQGRNRNNDDRYRSSRNDEGYDYRNQNQDRDWWDRTTDEVASWFGDDEAERRRRMDKLMGPHHGKGPKGYTRSDEKIKDEINDKLYNDSYIDASDIDVSVTEGEVTLTGTVDDKSTKRRAEDIAENISGVKDITNHIKVNRNAGSSWNASTGNTGATGSSLDQSDDLIRRGNK